jgi:hypothetical protein
MNCNEKKSWYTLGNFARYIETDRVLLLLNITIIEEIVHEQDENQKIFEG